jgi:DNA-binding response OmpR family regulator
MDKRHIFLVDNEEKLIECLTLCLKLEDFMVTSAGSAEEAINKLVEIYDGGAAVDLLVTDVWMPEFSGIELLEKLDQKNINPPVLGISGYFDDETKKKLSKFGCRNFLSKPFDSDEFLERIRGILGED